MERFVQNSTNWYTYKKNDFIQVYEIEKDPMFSESLSHRMYYL